MLRFCDLLTWPKKFPRHRTISVFLWFSSHVFVGSYKSALVFSYSRALTQDGSNHCCFTFTLTCFELKTLKTEQKEHSCFLLIVLSRRPSAVLASRCHRLSSCLPHWLSTLDLIVLLVSSFFSLLYILFIPHWSKGASISFSAAPSESVLLPSVNPFALLQHNQSQVYFKSKPILSFSVRSGCLFFVLNQFQQWPQHFPT